MRISMGRLVLITLPVLLATLFVAGCFNPSSTPDAAGPQDSSPDRAVSDTLTRDGPLAEGLKPDSSPTDLARPDAPDLFTKDSAGCPTAKSVWGKMLWDEGCLWL